MRYQTATRLLFIVRRKVNRVVGILIGRNQAVLYIGTERVGLWQRAIIGIMAKTVRLSFG